MKKVCIAALAFSVACMASAGTLTVKFGSAMEVEFDGEVQKFAKGDTFVPVAIPCLYRMRPVLADGERTFAIEGSETIRGNDKCWRFPQYGEGNWVRVALDPYPVDDTTVTLTAHKTSNFFYVDAKRGNDSWDGTADYDHRDEQSLKGPKKTLQASHDAATGDYPVIFAAPGNYDQGTATNYSSGTSKPCVRRLIATKKYIGFIATEGPENTFIVGARDESGTSGKFGSESVGGVYMHSNYQQFLQGFTITGCYSPAAQSGSHQYGMAFCSGAHRAYCLDCVISNNYAVTSGAATYYGVIERARIAENESVQFTTRNGVFVSCIFAGNKVTMDDSSFKNRALHQSGYSYFCTYDLPKRKRLEDDDSFLRAALVYGLTEKSETTTNATRWLSCSRVIDEPLFASIALRDYRLTVNSPARNVPSYTDDLDGNARMLLTSDVDGRMPILADGRLNLGAVWNEILRNTWYVAQDGGDDDNDGLSPSNAKATISAATELAFSGDVIRVAPGTYGEEEGVQALKNNVGARIVVPEDVTLESTEGAEKTFIVGADATGEQIDNYDYGTGTNAVRCVYAKRGSIVRGFTLTGGRTVGVADANNSKGSAFYSAVELGAVVEDCIVSNNAVFRGTIYQSVVRRCRIFDNVALNNAQSGSAGLKCSLYGCVIDRNGGHGTVSYSFDIANCTFGNANDALNNGANFRVVYTAGDRSLVNCAILAGGLNAGDEPEKKKLCLTNCLVVSNWMWGAEQKYNTIYTNSAGAMVDVDSGYAPVFGSFAGIDKGDATLLPDGLGNVDVLGNPRILNGAMDIGAVEYDWRPVFGGKIGRRFDMTYASPSVTTNVSGGLLIREGGIAGKAVSDGIYEFRFELSGGSVSVYVGDALVGECSDSGTHAIRLKITDATDKIRFDFVPDVENAGYAVIREFANARGLVMSLR